MPYSRAETLKFKAITVADLAFPEREGGYTKGHSTREQILHAALVILVKEGYQSLSMRRIAASCDMKLGNLTYHFPTREDLMRELLDAVIRAYEIEFDELVHMPDSAPEERLAEICGLVLEDITTEKTTRLFPELWALANQDEFVFDRLQELYARARAPLREIINEIRPDLDETSVEALAMFISASMEGLTIFAGYKKPFETQMPLYERIAIQSFIEIVRSFDPELGHPDKNEMAGAER
ncbi:MAG: TetR family transcriptional regulator [Sphingomonadaceae bacterium]|nr:TetR family transcriptional regulator [Sphingomonadaceae bacterium]